MLSLDYCDVYNVKIECKQNVTKKSNKQMTLYYTRSTGL